jgi:hypothetical protein
MGEIRDHEMSRTPHPHSHFLRVGLYTRGTAESRFVVGEKIWDAILLVSLCKTFVNSTTM